MNFSIFIQLEQVVSSAFFQLHRLPVGSLCVCFSGCPWGLIGVAIFPSGLCRGDAVVSRGVLGVLEATGRMLVPLV